MCLGGMFLLWKFGLAILQNFGKMLESIQSGGWKFKLIIASSN